MPDFVTPADETATEFHLGLLISALCNAETIPEEHKENLWYTIDRTIEALPEIDDKRER